MREAGRKRGGGEGEVRREKVTGCCCNARAWVDVDVGAEERVEGRWEGGRGQQVAHNDRYVDGTLSAAWKCSFADQDLHIQIRCAQSFQPMEVSLAWSGWTKCMQKMKSECRIYSLKE